MTPEEYLALPEEKPYLEYVDGVVLQKPMPNEEHSRIAFRIGFLIQTWLGEDTGQGRRKPGQTSETCRTTGCQISHSGSPTRHLRSSAPDIGG
ncbi:MAG: Uma2 family endonuclease [Dehalococcoidia bacterium]|nr:Uma2 family endonuclease [Dehalococcoidia bacterium]